MQKTINQFIWKYSARQQITLALMTIAYFPALYAMLELPKIIINSAISVSQPHQVMGFTLEPIQFLVFLCSVYFIMYLVNGLIKLVINIKKGVMGERMVRRLRYELIEQLLRFPIPLRTGDGFQMMTNLFLPGGQPLRREPNRSIRLHHTM